MVAFGKENSVEKAIDARIVHVTTQYDAFCCLEGKANLSLNSVYIHRYKI